MALESSGFPTALMPLISAYHWQRVTVGDSGADVFRLTAPGRSSCYLKIVARGPTVEVAAEARRMAWLAGRLPVPQVLAFAEDARGGYLLMSEVPGLDATDDAHYTDTPRLVRLLARGLRTIHTLPVAGCPFDHRLDNELERARLRMRHGLVDEGDFDPERQGRRAVDLFEELLATRPHQEYMVYTHGDYCLPNVLIDDGQIGGFIDLGRAGVGDRYRDLALAARSITRNIGVQWVPVFFREYGLDTPDLARLQFFQVLDEFF